MAELVGGKRTWQADFETGHQVDVTTEDFVLEVKNYRTASMADIERWLAHNEVKAAALGKRSGLVYKRKVGRGNKPSPYLLIVSLEPTDQTASPEGDST